MLQRPILYTGLTRAKQSLVLLGDSTAFEIGLNTQGQLRHTQLQELILSYFDIDQKESDVTISNTSVNKDEEAMDTIYDVDTKDDQIILCESTIYQINPMINMGDVSPYDFAER